MRCESVRRAHVRFCCSITGVISMFFAWPMTTSIFSPDMAAGLPLRGIPEAVNACLLLKAFCPEGDPVGALHERVCGFLYAVIVHADHACCSHSGLHPWIFFLLVRISGILRCCCRYHEMHGCGDRNMFWFS